MVISKYRGLSYVFKKKGKRDKLDKYFIVNKLFQQRYTSLKQYANFELSLLPNYVPIPEKTNSGLIRF